jgi:hypothetical protein
MVAMGKLAAIIPYASQGVLDLNQVGKYLQQYVA